MNKVFDWSEYWLNEGVTGECFVDKSGNKNDHLGKFWNAEFLKINNSSNIVDLASGGGSIYSGNIQEDKNKYYAVDVSKEALKQLKTRMPNVTTIVSSIDNIDLPTEGFDLVVSQFGIEYAGEVAFVEAARLMKVGGKLMLLSHIKDGFIDSKNKIEYDGVTLLNSTRFLDKSIAVTRARYEGNKSEFEQRFSEFTKIEPEISKWALSHKNSLVNHAYSGFRKMYENIKSYHMSDIVTWLEGIGVEKQKSEIRLKEMRKAALSPEKVENLCATLYKCGLTLVEFKPFTLPDQSLPIAWLITGKK